MMLPNRAPSKKPAGQMVRDCTGQWVTVPHPLVGVELFVAWADTRNERRAIDTAMQDAIEGVARGHRADVWRAMNDGWQSGEYDRVLFDAVPRYEAVIQEYTGRLQAATQRWAMDEARRQARSRETSNAPGSGPVSEASVISQIQQQAGKLDARIESSSRIAAREIAQRVQAEVAGAARDGKRPARWASAISAASLAKPVLATGQIIESEGRLTAAANLVQSGATQQLGLRLSQVVRTSVNDPRRCSVCEDRSGTTYDLPRQQREFDAMPLPDPDCLGGTRFCRCGWLLRWVRT
jgi:hypothetical protein